MFCKETVHLLLGLNKHVFMCLFVCVCMCVCVGKIRNFLNFKRWPLGLYCCGTTRVIQLQSDDANGGSKHAGLSCGAL
jgi:hypothetical protein